MLMKLEYLSHGHNASVFRDSLAPSICIEGPLIRREENDEAEDHYVKLFNTHLLAYILFPDNFPKPIKRGIDRMSTKTMMNIGGVLKYAPVHILYTQEVTIPQDHHVFTNHINTGEFGEKIRTCSCPSCSTHDEYHSSYRSRMFNLLYQIKEAGIEVPFDDPTDWCVENDKVIFFEVEHLDPKKIRHHMSANYGPDHIRFIDQLLRSLER